MEDARTPPSSAAPRRSGPRGQGLGQKNPPTSDRKSPSSRPGAVWWRWGRSWDVWGLGRRDFEKQSP